jgi:hypothetical protein
MLDSDVIQKIEDGEIGRTEAILTAVELYREAWTRVGSLRMIFEALGEDGTASKLNDALDSLDNATDEYYSIDMDGNVHVHEEA